MLSDNSILIHRYLNDDLNTEELAAFKHRLENDVDFLKEVFLDKIIQETLQNIAIKEQIAKTRRIAESLGDELYTEEELASIEAAIEQEEWPAKATPEIYTWEELMEPLTIEDAAILIRSSTQQTNEHEIQVVQPSHKEQCIEHQLHFKLKKAVPISLKVKIENKKLGNIPLLIEDAYIESNTIIFTVNLPDTLPPGRYYWELQANSDDMAVITQYGIPKGMFFIPQQN